MIERILVAVNDSPAALAAFRSALDLASRYGALVRALHVLNETGASASRARATGLGRDPVPLLRHLIALADKAGFRIEAVELHGEPAHRILEQARSWPADLVVIGRSNQQGAGGPWVGKETRMVLEFADQPVLVVPRDSALHDHKDSPSSTAATLTPTVRTAAHERVDDA